MFDHVAILIPFRPDSGNTRARAFARVVEYYQKTLPGARLVTGSDPDPVLFNRGRALNNIARLLRASPRGLRESVLVFADADLLVPRQRLRRAVDDVRNDMANGNDSWLVPFTCVKYLDRRWTSILLDQEDHPVWSGSGWMPLAEQVEHVWKARSTGGISVISRDRFEVVGGFDERLRGWGYEDAALYNVWEALVGPVRWVHGTALHLWHEHSRDEDPEARAVSAALATRYQEAYGDPDKIRAIMREEGARPWS